MQVEPQEVTGELTSLAQERRQLIDECSEEQHIQTPVYMQAERQELTGELNALAQERRQLVDERDEVQPLVQQAENAVAQLQQVGTARLRVRAPHCRLSKACWLVWS
jgi:DNA repair exonuclease SbcCD ATPase subunit